MTLLYSLNEAARELSIGKRKLEELVAEGKVETVQIGRRRLVPSESLTEYIDRLKASA